MECSYKILHIQSNHFYCHQEDPECGRKLNRRLGEDLGIVVARREIYVALGGLTRLNRRHRI